MAVEHDAAQAKPLMLRTFRRSPVSALLSFIALTAVVVGILAMHVWMGGQGVTSLAASVPVASTMTAESTPAPSATRPFVADGTFFGQASADVQALLAENTPSDARIGPDTETGMKTLPAITAPPGTDSGSGLGSDHNMSAGCGGDCSDEMAMGMCVLAMIAVGLAVLLTPSRRALLSSMCWRGPPAVVWTSRPARTPSLTQLCISRT